MSIGDEIDAAAKTFAAAGIDAARNDAEWIAAAALGTRRSEVVGHLDAEMPDEAGERFKKMIMRRARREPLAYIVGTVVFRGLELEVGAGCLVPRPETEVTAERAILRARDGSKRPTVVDVGTGCGAIALAMRCRTRASSQPKRSAPRGAGHCGTSLGPAFAARCCRET